MALWWPAVIQWHHKYFIKQNKIVDLMVISGKSELFTTLIVGFIILQFRNLMNLKFSWIATSDRKNHHETKWSKNTLVVGRKATTAKATALATAKNRTKQNNKNKQQITSQKRHYILRREQTAKTFTQWNSDITKFVTTTYSNLMCYVL